MCQTCGNVAFCNEDCLINNREHTYECGTQFHSIEFGGDIEIKLAIQLVLTSLSIYGGNVDELFEAVRNLLNDDNKIELDIPTRVSTDAHRFEFIMRLCVRDDPSLGCNVFEAFSIMMQFEEIQNLITTDEHKYSLQHLLAHFFMVIPGNCFSLRAINSVKSRVLYDLPSFFNHSCSPNVLHIVEGSKMTLVTSREIKVREQLFITYRNFDYQENTAQRREELIEWGFACRCERCIYADGNNGREITEDDLEEIIQISDDSKKQWAKHKFNNFENKVRKACTRTTGWRPNIGAIGMLYYDLCLLRAD